MANAMIDPTLPAPDASSGKIPISRAPLSPGVTDISREIWNLPNSLTFLRIFLIPVLVVVLLTKFEGREYVGLAIFLAASLTDFLDGYFARKFKKVTTVGILLDPIADKLLISAALISLIELGLAPAWMIVIIVGREFAVSGLRSIASQQGITIAASPLGKWKTVSQIIAVSILILGYELGEFMFIGKVALWVVMLFALGSGLDYFVRFSKTVINRPPPSA